MPLDREVGFLAVDEIQMAADPERGPTTLRDYISAVATPEE
jgi:hypothetical protein